MSIDDSLCTEEEITEETIVNNIISRENESDSSDDDKDKSNSNCCWSFRNDDVNGTVSLSQSDTEQSTFSNFYKPGLHFRQKLNNSEVKQTKINEYFTNK